MAFRLVTGNISTIVGAANNATVKFRLSAGSYTSQAQYLKTARNAITNAQGYFEIRLWVNTEGIIPTRYICILPDGESFEFSLEPGTTPVDISAARAFGQSAPPAGTTLGMIEARIDGAIAAHDHNSGAHPNGIAGDSGPGGTDYRFERLNLSQYPNFQLTAIAAKPELTILTVQTIKQSFGIDFVIDGSILRWQGFPFKSEWVVEVLYK